MLKPETENWINAQWVKADEAIEVLTAEKKRAGAVYDERKRKVEHFKSTLRDMKADEDQGDLIAAEDVLSPELDALLRAPLNGIG